MARKKMNFHYIPDDSTRRGTFKRRTRGLMKKAGELAILCDAKPCVIIYGEGEMVPQVFPSQAEAEDILNQFKNMPEVKQSKKMDQQFFLLQHIGKLRDEIQKSGRNCHEHEIRSLLYKAMLGNLPSLMGLSIEDINNVGLKVEMLLKSIGDHIMKIRSQPPVYQPSPVQDLTPSITDMNIIRPTTIYPDDASSQQQEGWLEMLKYGGGDLGALVYSGFNGGCDGVTSTPDLSVVQPFDLGNWSGCP